MDLRALTIDAAKQLEGTTFEVDLPDGRSLRMTLTEALPYEIRQRRRSRGAPATTRLPFALYFVSPSDAIPQGMYDFRSAEVAFEGLFIVPVGHDDEGTEYEAVFT
jgi:hypothetical protein